MINKVTILNEGMIDPVEYDENGNIIKVYKYFYAKTKERRIGYPISLYLFTIVDPSPDAFNLTTFELLEYKATKIYEDDLVRFELCSNNLNKLDKNKVIENEIN